MQCILLYDIPHDGRRQKVADACLDYGLDRVQYSAFLGPISRNLQEELFQKAVRILGKKDGRIVLIPISQKEWTRRLSHAQGDPAAPLLDISP